MSINDNPDSKESHSNKDKVKGSMKSVKSNRQDDEYKNREEFVSNDPSHRKNQNLDKEGINNPDKKNESSGATTKNRKDSNGGYDHPPQGAGPYKEED